MSQEQRLDDRDLFRAMAPPASAQDAREALATLYGRYASDVQRFLRRIVSDPNDADDLMQETFLTAARHASAFRSGSALPWLLTIAGRRARDLLRSRRRRARRERDRAHEERVREADARAELEQALDRLPPKLRAAVELRFVNELSHAETARVLGVSLRTAKDWAKRGLEALRERMEMEDER